MRARSLNAWWRLDSLFRRYIASAGISGAM
jgi:hypothetical protein